MPASIYLHIGRNKAGSTTLQDYFAGRAKWLADNGIRYMPFGHLADSVAGLPGVASHDALIAAFRADPSRSIFCSNEIISGLPEHLATRMAADLAPLNVRVILYVRPYRAWVRSSYAYDVRCGCNGSDFDSYLQALAPRISFLPTARIWGRALGWDRVRVRSTNTLDLAGGELISDCIAALGLEPPMRLAHARRNEAPHWMAIELLRMAANRPGAPAQGEAGWNFEGMAIAEALHKIADEAIAASGLRGTDVEYLKQQQARMLSSQYNADLDALRAESGVSLQPDDAADAAERPFLPEAARVPRTVLWEIALRAADPNFVQHHPEAAAYIVAPEFRALLAGRPVLVQEKRPTHVAVEYSHMMQAGTIQVRTMTAPAAADAFALAGRGDLLAAIDVGMRVVRDDPDLALLAAMAEWRRDAFAETVGAPGPAEWPPSAPDPFPGQSGIPAIPAADLTAEILAGALLHHGSLRVNGLVPQATAQMLREGIDRALAAQTEVNAERPVTDPGWYVKLDVPTLNKARQWSEGCGAVWAADSPPMLAKTIAALRESGVLDHIAELMGERPALSVAKSTLRRVAPVSSHDWHQDGAFLGRNVRSVNVWLALSDCGVDAPGMDVVGCRLPYVLQTHSHGAYFDWSVGNGLVDILAEGGAPVLTPHFGPGDALLFDHMMLHRTSVKPGMTKDRYAIESWFFAPTNYPMDQIPLVV